VTWSIARSSGGSTRWPSLAELHFCAGLSRLRRLLSTNDNSDPERSKNGPNWPLVADNMLIRLHAPDIVVLRHLDGSRRKQEINWGYPDEPQPYPCIHALNEADKTFEPQITTAARLPR
jgi:hypothetical protein